MSHEIARAKHSHEMYLQVRSKDSTPVRGTSYEPLPLLLESIELSLSQTSVLRL